MGHLLLPRRRPRRGHLLRRAPDRADELPPDDAGLRHERQRTRLRPRRPPAAAQRGPARLQASQVDQGHRVRRALLTGRWRPGRVQPGPRVLRLPAEHIAALRSQPRTTWRRSRDVVAGTLSADGFTVVEGRGPDDVPVLVTYPGPNDARRHKTMQRICEW